MPEEASAPRSSAVARGLPWAAWLLVVAISVATLLLFPPVGTDARDLPTYLSYWLSLLWSPMCALVGALITSNRRGNRIGWLLVALGLLVSLLLFASGASDTEHPAATAFNVVSGTLWILFIALFAILILVFPDGQPLSPRWRPMVWFAGLWPLAFLLIGVVFDFQSLLTDVRPSGLFGIAMAAFTIVTGIAITASALLRFTRSRGVERQQLKWFAFAWIVGLAALIVGAVIPVWGGVIGTLGLYGPIAGIAVALFRHRLYDVDVLINRTFVYGALVAVLAGLYTASIRLFNALFVGVTGLGSEEVLVITTLILATTFTPIKKWLEDLVERRYKTAGEEAVPTPQLYGAVDQLNEPAAFPAIEARLRTIVREELERADHPR